MLAEGLVDQVLVLCPSRTIESGLTEKFVALAGNKMLKKLLPKISFSQSENRQCYTHNQERRRVY